MKPLKRIYHYLQQRYGAMWSLLLFVLVMLGLIVMQVFGWSANWHPPDADKYLGWMYACNLGCLLIISVQLLRLDCRAAPFYAEDSSFIYLLCLLLFFCASMVRRAVKIKEEQDLTI